MTAWSTLGLAAATVLLVIPTFLIAWGVGVEVGKYREDSKFLNYTQIDNIYYSIQKEIIRHPHLSEPIVQRNEDQRRQYDTFAFMTWNFIEAISDQSKNDKELDDTWYVIIRYESHRHRNWFLEERNYCKFKRSFREFIGKELFQLPDGHPIYEVYDFDLAGGGGSDGVGRT